MNEVHLEIMVLVSVDINTLKITTDDRDIRLVEMNGTIDDHTQTGQIKGLTNNSNNGGNPVIALSSDSGSIIIE